jgi:GNAT superfamily N-acetyltransferase
MEIIIRSARLAELEILKSFEQGIVEYERPYGDTLKEQGVSYYDLEELILSADAHILVATSNEEVIGSGYIKIVPSKDYYTHSHHAHLGFMYVIPEFRGKGINKMIIDKLLNWARSKDIVEARLEVYAENEGAVKAYTKTGFGPNLLEMRMTL